MFCKECNYKEKVLFSGVHFCNQCFFTEEHGWTSCYISTHTKYHSCYACLTKKVTFYNDLGLYRRKVNT